MIVFVYRNNLILLSALENQIFSPFGLYSALIGLKANQTASLTFGQTSQLILETKLLEVIEYKSYIILLPTLENHIFPMLFYNSALISPSLGQSGLKVWLIGKTFKLRL